MTVRHDTPKCGPFLIDLRRREKLTQKQLAERTGMTQANISRIERDKVSPTLHTLNRLLEAMGHTLWIDATPLNDAPPGGGNVSIRQLRVAFDDLSPDERLQQGVALTRVAGKLARGAGSGTRSGPH